MQKHLDMCCIPLYAICNNKLLSQVQYLSGCIAAVARILVNLRENMAGAVFQLQASNIHHTAWKESDNHKLYAAWLQVCRRLLNEWM